ncbi:MAG: hypothetical protein ACMXYF_04910 [Candidatus Woesearchaeota archaeon]
MKLYLESTRKAQQRSYDAHVIDFLNTHAYERPTGFGLIRCDEPPTFVPELAIHAQEYGLRPKVIDIADIRRNCGLDGVLLTKNDGQFAKLWYFVSNRNNQFSRTRTYNIVFAPQRDLFRIFAHNLDILRESEFDWDRYREERAENERRANKSEWPLYGTLRERVLTP